MLLSFEERAQLARAKFLLENPSLAAKITAAIEIPIEKGFGQLPAGWRTTIQEATNKALMSALNVAVGTMGIKKVTNLRQRFIKALWPCPAQ